VKIQLSIAMAAAIVLAGCGSSPVSSEQRRWCVANPNLVEAAHRSMRGGGEHLPEGQLDARAWEAACLLAYRRVFPEN
jgi:hypothetical protein